MTLEQATQAVTGVQQHAETAARQDLVRLRAQALQAGQNRAEELFPQAGRSGPLPVVKVRGSRLLRSWYSDVYATALRNRLGERLDVPAAAEIDTTATALRRVLGSRDPDVPLRMAGLLHQRAVTDAVNTANGLRTALADAAPRRAAVHIAGREPTDAARTAILQHWHQRCYLAVVDAQLGLLQPLQAVTVAEAREVAAAVDHGRARQLIGPDNIPLITRHGTAMTDTDRHLAAGMVGVVSPPTWSLVTPANNTLLRTRVVRSWNNTGGQQPGTPDPNSHRAVWATAAGVPASVAAQSWQQIPGDHQSRLIAHWLDTHTARVAPDPKLVVDPPPPEPPYPGAQRLLTGSPQAAAAAMFNHPTPPPAQPSPGLAAARAMFPASTTRNPAGTRAPSAATSPARTRRVPQAESQPDR